MCKFSKFLFLILIKVIYVQTQGTSYYQAITEQQAVESLVEIQHNQALPLVLLIENTSMELKFPAFLSKVFTDKGRIIHRTLFTGKKASKQFFFCPKENSVDKCLVYKEFLSSEPLQCATEPIPILREEETGCAFNDVGTLYTLFYEVCPNQKNYDFKSREIQVYEVCYHTREKRILFINHKIRHPKLIKSNILHWEHKIQYNMESMNEFILSNQSAIEAAMTEEEQNLLDTEDQQHQKKKQKTDKHVYKAQKLIPTEDMAFALWRKPTFQYINIELQHEKLINLWNEINHYIRRNAGEILVSKGIETYARTGVFGLNSKPRDDGQLSNMWVKLIYFITYDEKNIKGAVTHAMVILMNNFIDSMTHPGTLSNLQGTTIDDYCDQDLCAESLKKQFNEVGGRIRCCSMTRKMVELFGENNFVVIKEVLLIPGINEITDTE